MNTKHSAERKKAISEGMQKYWEGLRQELEESNRALEAMGMPTYTLREYRMGLPPKGNQAKQRKPRSKEHKQKLREKALALNYAERLKPYHTPAVQLSSEERQKKKQLMKLKRQEAASKRRAAERMARQAMVGALGADIQLALKNVLGSLNVHDKSNLAEAVEALTSMGFIESFYSVPEETRKRMSEAAKTRHARDRKAKEELKHNVNKRLRKEM